MVEVTLVKNRFRKEQWQQLILECQGSTLTVIDCCAGAGITHHAYYYWLRNWKHAVLFQFRLKNQRKR